MKEVDADANRDVAIRKLNSLRSALKKVLDSKHSGISTDDVYEPWLWYYDHLTFIADEEIQREGKSSLDADDIGQGEEEGDRNSETEHIHKVIFKFLLFS